MLKIHSLIASLILAFSLGASMAFGQATERRMTQAVMEDLENQAIEVFEWFADAESGNEIVYGYQQCSDCPPEWTMMWERRSLLYENLSNFRSVLYYYDVFQKQVGNMEGDGLPPRSKPEEINVEELTQEHIEKWEEELIEMFEAFADAESGKMKGYIYEECRTCPYKVSFMWERWNILYHAMPLATHLENKHRQLWNKIKKAEADKSSQES